MRCGIRQGRRAERDPRPSLARMSLGTRSRGLLPRRFRDSPRRALCAPSARCRARLDRAASSRRRRVRHIVPGGPRSGPGFKRRRALCERTAFTSAWISAMVMAGKSDAASMSAASNRPSTAQRRRFSRSIASRASEASSPASPASSASLSGKSIVSVATIRVSPARCSNTGLGHLRPGGSQTTFDSSVRSEIPTRIACRTNPAHAPVPVSEGHWRQDVHGASAYNFGANVLARAEFTARAPNGSLSRTVNPAARMAPTMSLAIRVRPMPRNAPASRPATVL